MEEKQVYLLSDSCKQHYKNNRPSSFSNDIPKHLFKGSSVGRWYVSLAEVQFQNSFLNKYLPPTAPVLALTEKDKEVPDLSTTLDNHKIYMPHKTYSQLDLITFLSRDITNPCPLKLYYASNTDTVYFRFPKNLTRMYNILIHPPFYKFLFGVDSLYTNTITTTDGLTFVLLDPSTWQRVGFTPFVILRSTIPLKQYMETYRSPLVFIRSTNIVQQSHSPKLADVLGIVSVGCFDNQNRIHCEVKHRYFFPLNIRSLETLKVQLTDIDSNEVFLAKGQSTLMKLILTKMPEYPGERLVRVTSLIDSHNDNNKASKFVVRLPQPLPFNSCKVALSAISFPTSFQNELNVIQRTIKVKYVDIESGKEDAVISFVVPKVVHNIHELHDSIHYQTSFDVSVAVEDGILVLKPPVGKEMTVTLSKKLYLFLGGAPINSDDDDEDIEIVESTNYKFARPPKFQDLVPSNLFVFTNLVDYTAVADEPKQILKVVPLINCPYGTYTTIESQHLDFHLCIPRRPQIFSFEIKTHDGILCPFKEDKNEPVILDLLFVNNPVVV